MSDSNTPMLQVRGLKKYFPIYKGLFRSLKGTVKAVDDLSFDLHAKVNFLFLILDCLWGS